MKGVAEFADKKAVFAVNLNPAYLRAVAQDPYEFRRKNGVFTQLYDSAKRFGENKVF